MFRLFRGLRWKLTLSYTIVTVATLLVVEIILIVGIGYLIIHSNLLPTALIYAMETFITPQVATYLDRHQPDVESMTEWLKSAFADGLTFQSSQNPKIIFELGELEQGTSLIVLDQNLDQLTSIPGSTESMSYRGAEDLLKAAQNGKNDPDSIARIDNGFLTTAVPVSSEEGSVLGVVVMIMPYPPRGSITQALSLVGVSLILFTIVVGLIGTVFGYFTARGLTKRLSTVSLATNSWSQGDFSTFINDRIGDEIGQLAQQLNRMAEQLQNLLQTKEELATLEERNRLARDLHDGVKQQVFAAAMQVGAAQALLDKDTRAAKERLNEAEELTRQAQTELNIIIHELAPVTLQDKGLFQALKEHVADWSRVHHITADVNLRGEGALPLEVEQALFRVAQEALSNIARHAEAKNAEIEMEWEKDEVVISISDDGRGFDVAAAEGKGVGLRSMSERVKVLGGSLRVESLPEHGTSLTARIPISTVEPS
jgi:NarL family two-component system sensor histidine kinase LiaS